jgi:hypothetical protein
MKKIVVVILLTASPAWAQTQIARNAAPRGTSARATDACAPIGRTAKGELVYSMRCDALPTPVPPPAQAEGREAPAPPPPEAEVQRSGIFGWSYDRRQ